MPRCVLVLCTVWGSDSIISNFLWRGRWRWMLTPKALLNYNATAFWRHSFWLVTLTQLIQTQWNIWCLNENRHFPKPLCLIDTNTKSILSFFELFLPCSEMLKTVDEFYSGRHEYHVCRHRVQNICLYQSTGNPTAKTCIDPPWHLLLALWWGIATTATTRGLCTVMQPFDGYVPMASIQPSWPLKLPQRYMHTRYDTPHF